MEIKNGLFRCNKVLFSYKVIEKCKFGYFSRFLAHFPLEKPPLCCVLIGYFSRFTRPNPIGDRGVYMKLQHEFTDISKYLGSFQVSALDKIWLPREIQMEFELKINDYTFCIQWKVNWQWWSSIKGNLFTNSILPRTVFEKRGLKAACSSKDDNSSWSYSRTRFSSSLARKVLAGSCLYSCKVLIKLLRQASALFREASQFWKPKMWNF